MAAMFVAEDVFPKQLCRSGPAGGRQWSEICSCSQRACVVAPLFAPAFLRPHFLAAIAASTSCFT
eukprot:4636743-Pyramimonas_sp.AAC.1